MVNQLQMGLDYSYFIADWMEAGRDEVTRITQGYTGIAGTFDYCRLHDIQVPALSPLRPNVFTPPKLLNLPGIRRKRSRPPRRRTRSRHSGERVSDVR